MVAAVRDARRRTVQWCPLARQRGSGAVGPERLSCVGRVVGVKRGSGVMRRMGMARMCRVVRMLRFGRRVR